MTAVTLYRPAYSASALKGTIFDDFNWIGMWTAAWAVSDRYLHDNITASY
jgi:hypothetical protein